MSLARLYNEVTVEQPMRIRDERSADRVAVRVLVESAFDGGAEAALVDMLRAEARPLVSLVAVADDGVVGHIMFSPVRLPGHPEVTLMGLGPVAVLPERQHRGVGTALVRAGLERCAALGAGAVVVLGHPEYYARFGFLSASSFGIGCEFDAPEEAFMLLEIERGYLAHKAGAIEYHRAFRDCMPE